MKPVPFVDRVLVWPRTYGGVDSAPEISQTALHLLMWMIDMEPTRRPSTAQILCHPYLCSVSPY
jgi:serine/threonine protein kinase